MSDRCGEACFGGLDEPPIPSDDEETEPPIERGAAIARDGIPGQRVPACADCHGPGDGERNPIYPSLAGQYADYLVLQLELFKKRHRGGTDFAHLMHPVADGLTANQMRDVALYYQSLWSYREDGMLRSNIADE